MVASSVNLDKRSILNEAYAIAKYRPFAGNRAVGIGAREGVIGRDSPRAVRR